MNLHHSFFVTAVAVASDLQHRNKHIALKPENHMDPANPLFTPGTLKTGGFFDGGGGSYTLYIHVH